MAEVLGSSPSRPNSSCYQTRTIADLQGYLESEEDNLMKYIKCDNCGSKIPLGEQVVSHRMYCGIYCSDKCFLIAAAPDREVSTLTLDFIEKHNAEIEED